MERVRKADALTIPQFNERLREFVLDAAPRETVGGARDYGGTVWIWVKHQDRHYHLNADSTAEGVAAYLGLARNASGGRFHWSIVPNRRGKLNKVAFGDPPAAIPGF